jgi:hypothetical protein
MGCSQTRSLGVAPGGVKKKEGERVVVTASKNVNVFMIMMMHTVTDERERGQKRKGVKLYGVTSHS